MPCRNIFSFAQYLHRFTTFKTITVRNGIVSSIAFLKPMLSNVLIYSNICVSGWRKVLVWQVQSIYTGRWGKSSSLSSI